MIAAGEAGGILDTILKRLAVYIEKNVKLKGEVNRDDLSVAVIIAGLVVAAILWKVIPTFASLFAGLMPSCRCRLAWSSPRATCWSVTDGRRDSGRNARCALKQNYATNNGRHLIDALMLGCPFWGTFCGRSRSPGSAARLDLWPRAFDSGQPRHHREDRRNAIIEDAVQTPDQHRTRRNDLPPLRETNVFPDGRADDQRRRDHGRAGCDAQQDRRFLRGRGRHGGGGLLTLMEPVMIALGVIVGGIVIAMYLPIFDLISKLT
jgi:type IV pilus assembly protein PilC